MEQSKMDFDPDDDFFDDTAFFSFAEEPKAEPENSISKKSCEREIKSKKKEFQELENRSKELDQIVSEVSYLTNFNTFLF